MLQDLIKQSRLDGAAYEQFLRDAETLVRRLAQKETVAAVPAAGFGLTHRMTNGFAGTSRAVEIHTLFVSTYSRTASMPLSRPTPECFIPPNGIM